MPRNLSLVQPNFTLRHLAPEKTIRYIGKPKNFEDDIDKEIQLK